MKREWKEIKNDNTRAQWAGLYVTMNRKGTIVMNRAAHEKVGAPTAFKLLYDPGNNTIGLKPTVDKILNAYRANKSGRHGGRKISAFRLLAECSLHIDDTLEFPDADIDEDGTLILNLRTAKISNRATNHPSRRKPER